jgi:DNA-dependent RNA polymerase auxiliary subunit epsilon
MMTPKEIEKSLEKDQKWRESFKEKLTNVEFMQKVYDELIPIYENEGRIETYKKFMEMMN